MSERWQSISRWNDAEPLLGVTALESVGILVDEASKTFKRLPAIPLR